MNKTVFAVIGGDLRSANLDGFLTSLNGSEKS